MQPRPTRPPPLGALLDAAERAACDALGAIHVVAFNTGASALWHALRAAAARADGVDARGAAAPSLLQDAGRRQVFVPASCWNRVAPAVASLQATPVLYDVDFETAAASADAVTAALAKGAADQRAKVVVCHHTRGSAADLTAFAALAARKDVVVVEYADCTPVGNFCHGAKRRTAGSCGSFAAFEFGLPMDGRDGDLGLHDDAALVVCADAGDAAMLRVNRDGAACLAAAVTAHGRELQTGGGPALGPALTPAAALTLTTASPLDVRPSRLQCARLCTLFGADWAAMVDAARRASDALLQALQDASAAAAARHGGAPPFVIAEQGAGSTSTGAVIVLSRACAHQAPAVIDAINAAADAVGVVVTASPLFQYDVDRFVKVRAGDRAEDCPAAIALGARGVAVEFAWNAVVSPGEVAGVAAAVAGFVFRPRSVVLVTGAGGMLGRHVRNVLAMPDAAATCVSVFITRKDGNLVDQGDVDRIFARYQPTHVLHCAGMRDGLQGMNARLVDFWQGNVAMNDNVLRAAHDVQRWVGRVKVVSILSTVMFPRDCEYPMTADADRLYAGRQHPAAESYAAAKKALAQVSQWYRMQHGDAFTSIIPGNFYGQYGDFEPKTAPLVNALIARAEAARVAGDKRKLKVLGTGRPLRQVQHARDLARACVWALFHYDDFDPLIVAGAEYSVRRVAELVCQATGFEGGLEFDEDAVDGPLRRTADTSKFEALCPSHKDMDLLDGIKQTVAWYRQACGGGAVARVGDKDVRDARAG